VHIIALHVLVFILNATRYFPLNIINTLHKYFLIGVLLTNDVAAASQILVSLSVDFLYFIVNSVPSSKVLV
jgi:hypothetical protein